MAEPMHTEGVPTQPQTVVPDENLLNHGQWQRHDKFWYEDGSMVLRVQNLLYKIYIGIFTQLSPVLSEILSIPAQLAVGQLQEGTEAWPLFLAGFTIQEFDDFMAYLSPPGWKVTDASEQERMFTGLLKIADRWQISDARAYAITQLHLMPLLPSHRLELARMFTILEWVEPAVRTIFDGKLADLTSDDLDRIGYWVFVLLVKGKECMATELQRTASVAPKIDDHDWSCKKPDACAETFKRLWWEKVGRRLLHPVVPMKTFAIRWEVRTWKHADLNVACCDHMVQKMELKEIEFPDEKIIDGVVQAISNYYLAL
ncbi:hypothetical protein GGX14DRAFT_399681 [Mycena pura]|uniref:BTB domain-containing protein n=1 Tax=Mycena pura TaxID=153505 RepID=A0AAD6Y598_9AGAR|nr:hypothetical protein GGX14DRAFT_399681 [Mycena pura]